MQFFGAFRSASRVACLLAVAGLSMGAASAAERITVVLDEAKILQLPANTSTIVLGNPGIVDVSMLKRNNQMILTGKSFGQTNLIALDSDGKSVGESLVLVTNYGGGLVVQRGLTRETYHCAPVCNPTVTLGDDAKFMADTAGQVQQRISGSAPSGKK